MFSPCLFRCLIVTLSVVCGFFGSRIGHSGPAASTATGECPQGNFEVPNDWTVIEIERFSECRTIRSVTISDSVNTIGALAFAFCTNLQRVNFGNGVEWIGYGAFAYCSSLKSVTIPKSVKFVDASAFGWCYSLVKISVDSDNEFFVEKSGALIEVQQSSAKLIQCPGGKSGDFRVPQFVSSIEAEAFGGCKLITSVHLPEGINSIENGTFYGCNKLETVNLPDNLEFLGSYGFYQCYSLRSVCLGCIESIGMYTFAYCSSIETITIPKTCTSIGEGAFGETTSLSSVDFQGCAASIGKRAFIRCSALSDLYNMEHVTSIGVEAFKYCNAMRNAVLGDQFESVGLWAFWDCSSLCNVSLGRNVREIGDCAFGYCYSLTHLYIPKSVSSIGISCFAGCLSLEIESESGNSNYTTDESGAFISVTDGRLIRFPASRTGIYEIPDWITSLESYAFAGSQISSVSIPASVSEIGGSCFHMCMNLETITVDANNEHFKCIDGVIFSSDESVLVSFPSHRKGSYVIPESVCEIVEYVFAACQLESISVPDLVTSIPSFAFYMSESLESVTLGKGIESIGDLAFRKCVSLTSIVIPNQVTSVGDYVFSECESLKSVILGDSVETISLSMFYNCYSLSSINIPDSVTLIDGWAFENCYSLASIVLGNNVASIGESAFRYSGLTYILMPSSLKTIGQYAFQLCSNLTVINFTGTEEPEIGLYVFDQCYNIRYVFVPSEYSGNTLFGLVVTKDSSSEGITRFTQINRVMIFCLICICVFGVLDMAIGCITSPKRRMKYNSDFSEISRSLVLQNNALI